MRSQVAVSILTVALLASVATASAAQEAGVSRFPTKDTRVTFHVKFEQEIDDGSPVLFSSEVLERLTDDDHLAELDLHSIVKTGVRVQASFLFNGVSDFRTWYGSERIQKLIQELRDKSLQDVELVVRVRRHPHVQLMDDQN